MTLGELGKAGEAAERLLNNNSSFAKNLCSVYFFNADYQLNMGNREKALEYMEMGRQLIQAKTPSLMFYYDGTMKKLGLS